MSKYYTNIWIRFALLAWLVLCGQQLAGQDKTWTNAGGDGLWSNGANWDPAGAPGPGNDVIFDNTSSANCTVNINPSIKSLEADRFYGGTISLGTNTLTVGGAFKVEEASQLSSGPGSKVIISGPGRVDCVAPIHALEINTAQPTDDIDLRENLLVAELTITQVGNLDGDDLRVSQKIVNNDPALDGDAIISIAGNCTFTGNGLRFLNIETGANLQLLSSLTLERNFELTGSGDISGTGPLTFASGGRVNYSGNVSADVEFDFAGSIRISNEFSTAGNLTFTQVGSFSGLGEIRAASDITVNVPSVGNFLTIVATGSGALSGSGSLVRLRVEAGASLQLPSDFTLKGTFELTGGGTIAGPGKLVLGSVGQVDFTGTVSNVQINDPSGSRVGISVEEVFNISNDLLITQTGSFRGEDIRVGGNITITDNEISAFSNLVMAGNGTTSFQGSGGGNYRWMNLVIDKDNNTGKVLLNSSDTFLEIVVSEGILDLNGQSPTADVTVESGGTLAGVGTINGDLTVEAGGAVSPGNSPGIMTINGDVNISGTLTMEITGPGENNGGTPGTDFDRLNVNGDATIGTINVVFVGTIGPTFPVAGATYTLVSATGSSAISAFTITPNTINGTFTGGMLLIGNPAFPIELTYFTASAKGESVLLQWGTATEQNNDYMAVERSPDGVRFEEIGRVKGAGSTTEPRDYRLVDEQPIQGLNYYRLRQVDFDGAATYHRIVTALYRGKAAGLAFQASPNPVQDNLQAAWTPSPVLPTDLLLFDAHGRLLAEYRLPVGAGNLVVPMSHLAPGLYFLQASQGAKVQMAQIVKK